ncbi:class I SAM-dependent DNA methyltransferase [Hydrogenimonas sp.]
MGLELYARIEPLLGFEPEVKRLYALYAEILESWEANSLVDIGCGNGKFLKKLETELKISRLYGVDLSEGMVARAKALGVACDAKDICDVEERFDAATAVFDVLNYLPPERVGGFLGCVAERLHEGGVFLADINTFFGFEEVAPGTLVRHFDDRFLAVDATFEAGKLTTAIDYFEKEGECYRRESDRVVQYWHDPAVLAEACEKLALVQSYPVAMYGDEPDKEILLFKKL